MSKSLSDKQYREAGAGKCPCCGSDSLDGGSIDVQGSKSCQEVICNECNASWTDVYQLLGYTDLEDEQGEPIEHDEEPDTALPELKERLESSVKMMVNALDNMAYLFSKNGPDDLTPEAREWRKMLQQEVKGARAVLAKFSPKD